MRLPAVARAYSFCPEAKSYFSPRFIGAKTRLILNEYWQWPDIFAVMRKVGVKRCEALDDVLESILRIALRYAPDIDVIHWPHG
jgi:hypothetical protein